MCSHLNANDSVDSLAKQTSVWLEYSKVSSWICHRLFVVGNSLSSPFGATRALSLPRLLLSHKIKFLQVWWVWRVWWWGGWRVTVWRKVPEEGHHMCVWKENAGPLTPKEREREKVCVCVCVRTRSSLYSPAGRGEVAPAIRLAATQPPAVQPPLGSTCACVFCRLLSFCVVHYCTKCFL